jgi:hypothetical protein
MKKCGAGFQPAPNACCGQVGNLPHTFSEEVNLLFDTGAPTCNLDLDLANAPKGQKVSRELTLAERRFTLEFRARDLAVIRKSMGCGGVIGNNFLSQYSVYFDPGAKVIHLSSG